MSGASAGGVHIHRLWWGFGRKKTERVKGAKRPKDLPLTRSVLPAEQQARWMCGANFPRCASHVFPTLHVCFPQAAMMLSRSASCAFPGHERCFPAAERLFSSCAHFAFPMPVYSSDIIRESQPTECVYIPAGGCVSPLDP